jgi:hypothetical protein
MVLDPAWYWSLSGAGASLVLVLETACCLRCWSLFGSGARNCLLLGAGACLVLEPVWCWSLSGVGACLVLEPVWC